MDDGWSLLGAPWDSSGSGRGEQLAPAALRARGLARLVDDDLGDADTLISSTVRDAETEVRALADTVRAADALSRSLRAARADRPGRRPLVVGGDCSVLLGIGPALRRDVGGFGLWFVDGHPDFLDGRASETGETADMELAMMTGARLPGHAPDLPGPLVSPRDVVLVGHRTEGLDDASAAELARLPTGLHQLDAGTVRRDPGRAGERAASLLTDVGSGSWLHIDLDVLDPAVCAAVTYPQDGGPSWAELAAVVRPMARSGRLLGVSLADYRPDLDPSGSVADAVLDLLGSVLRDARGAHPPPGTTTPDS